MGCENCHYNKGILKDKVACGSMKHAKFMDIQGSSRYQRMVNLLGAMPLVSTESLRMECNDHITDKEFKERR